MTKLFAASALAFVLALSCPLLHAQQASPAPAPVSADALFTPANQVPPGKLPFTLRKVFHRLGHDNAESMPFAEVRTFAISKNPLRQTGQLRSSKEHGLSLSYESAKPHVIVVDDKGLIDRQPDGRERQVTVADHPEVATLTDLYLNLLRGNAEQLFKYADVYFSGTAQSWQMGLVSHDPALAKRVGRVVVSGAGRDIAELKNLLPNGEYRTLEFGHVTRNPKYSSEEVQKYFRGKS